MHFTVATINQCPDSSLGTLSPFLGVLLYVVWGVPDAQLQLYNTGKQKELPARDELDHASYHKDGDSVCHELGHPGCIQHLLLLLLSVARHILEDSVHFYN
jgi:hypothetical protein